MESWVNIKKSSIGRVLDAINSGDHWLQLGVLRGEYLGELGMTAEVGGGINEY